MKTMLIKYVVITDGKDYIIHGSAKQSSIEMFKQMAPLWDFNPETDTSFVWESEIHLPEPKGLKIDSTF